MVPDTPNETSSFDRGAASRSNASKQDDTKYSSFFQGARSGTAKDPGLASTFFPIAPFRRFGCYLRPEGRHFRLKTLYVSRRRSLVVSFEAKTSVASNVFWWWCGRLLKVKLKKRLGRSKTGLGLVMTGVCGPAVAASAYHIGLSCSVYLPLERCSCSVCLLQLQARPTSLEPGCSVYLSPAALSMWICVWISLPNSALQRLPTTSCSVYLLDFDGSCSVCLPHWPAVAASTYHLGVL